MTIRTILAVMVVATLGTPACEWDYANHKVPVRPLWADVEPILRADCLHCHGGSAQVTGSGSGSVYRFDFFDMTPETCGEAAEAVPASTSAALLAPLIANSITSVESNVRPRMPPAPASSLNEWEWKAILRWTALPERGPAPLGNRSPTVRLTALSPLAASTLHVAAVLDDPDGESAVGVLKIGALKLKMDRAGAFGGDIDTSEWEDGEVPVSAVVCDGWGTAIYNLGSVTIAH